MTHESFGRVSAASLIAETFHDLSDLLRKEMRLASAEMSSAVTTSLRASVMMVLSGALLLMALLFALGGLALIIAGLGFTLHEASFMVAGGLLLVGLALFLPARAQMRTDRLAPARTIGQLREAIRTAKEQMK